MFRDVSRELMAVALIAAGAALATPAGATGKLLDDYYNEGIEPHADLGASRPLAKPKQLKVEFSASMPGQRINTSFALRCYVRGKTKLARNPTFSGFAPFSVLVPIDGRLDTCRLTGAEARYADPFITGWLRIRVWGASR